MVCRSLSGMACCWPEATHSEPEDFAEYGLDEPSVADLRSWVTGWYDDLARRLAAELIDDELPGDL